MERKKKMGRPTDDPKGNDIRVRVNDELYAKISEYSEKHNITKAEAIRNILTQHLNEK